MKKILTALALLIVAGTASAQWHHGYRGGYYHGGCWSCGWVAPAVIGGVIGYELSRPPVYTVPAPVVVEQQPTVIVQQPSVVQQPPAGYHWQQMVDPSTNQTKIVLVPN